jgi:hypothetical protein
MASSTQPGRPIVAGFQWDLQVSAPQDPVFFPVGSTHVAHVRASVEAGSILATLTTGNGIARVDDDTCQLTIAADLSAAWKMASVTLDIVRTDPTPDRHGGFTLTIPVARPVTRGL